jgi:response regulator RpfG family c-di-GMP phosphodiesterase
MALREERTSVTIVDDEPRIRALLAESLGQWGFHTRAARCAEEAVDSLTRFPSPILLTDLRMPGRGGLWLIQEVRQRWPETYIIVITGNDDFQAAMQCLNAGARRYFLKPFNLSELRQALKVETSTLFRRNEWLLQQRALEEVARRQTRRARTTFLSAVESLFLTLEARDRYISGHSRRVRRYARALGREAGLDRRALHHLSLAAKLHDIGKVAIPERILHKAETLTPEERLVIQSHPIIGEEIIQPVVRSREVLAAIRGHHERVDGNGYPDGLAGKAIPLLARIISVVDCYDALTSVRPYRQPLGTVRALAVLNEVAGTQLDADLVRTFTRLLAGDPHLAQLRPALADATSASPHQPVAPATLSS